MYYYKKKKKKKQIIINSTYADPLSCLWLECMSIVIKANFVSLRNDENIFMDRVEIKEFTRY